VNITLSRRGDYAIRAILDVALHHGAGRRKTREIAEAMNVPPNYLSQILAILVRKGLLVAAAGQDGGYELARPPQDVSLLDVVEAVEGPATLQRCLLRGIPCGSDGTCAVHAAWSGAQQALTDRLAATTFAALAANGNALRADTPTPPSSPAPAGRASA
jgi:Rrf2 family protein